MSLLTSSSPAGQRLQGDPFKVYIWRLAPILFLQEQISLWWYPARCVTAGAQLGECLSRAGCPSVTILLFHTISARPSKQPSMVGSTLGVYSFGLIFVSARTSKQQHHHLLLRWRARASSNTHFAQGFGKARKSYISALVSEFSFYRFLGVFWVPWRLTQTLPLDLPLVVSNKQVVPIRSCSCGQSFRFCFCKNN